MEYEFMRRLTKNLPAELLGQALAVLLEQGIEVYTEAAADKEKVCYMAVDSAEQFRGGDIYIPAADRERAIELLNRLGAAGYICEDPVESLQMTEAQRLEADMIRRHRRNMAICLVVIVFVFIYYILS